MIDPKWMNESTIQMIERPHHRNSRLGPLNRLVSLSQSEISSPFKRNQPPFLSWNWFHFFQLAKNRKTDGAWWSKENDRIIDDRIVAITVIMEQSAEGGTAAGAGAARDRQVPDADARGAGESAVYGRSGQHNGAAAVGQSARTRSPHAHTQFIAS